MSRKTFLYYLFGKEKKPLYIDYTGFVTSGTEDLKKLNDQPAHLQTDPDGWQNVLVKYGRNTKYWGMFRDFTVPMRFVKDGAKILKWMFWNLKGVETICYFGMLKLDRLNLPYNYLNWFLSEINFAKYEEEGRDAVTVEVLEGGLMKFIKAFENTEYEIDIANDPFVVNVLMDGMEIANTATFAVTNGSSFTVGANIGNHIIDTMIINKEIQDIGGVYDVQRTKVAGNNPSVFDTQLYAFQATAIGTIHLKWNFDVRLTYVPPPAINPAAIFRIQARIINPSQVNNVTKVVTLEGWAAEELNGTVYHLEGEGTLDVVPGDQLYFVGAMTVEGASGDAQLEILYSGDEPTIDIGYTYKHSQSFVKGLRPKRLLEKLLEKMTGGLFTAINSPFLDSLREVVVTSAQALRQDKDSVIKTSYSNFFKSFSRWMIGAGVQSDVLVLDRLKQFFKDDVTIELGEVGRVKISVADDLFFNTIKVGYENQDYDSIAGRLEVNQGQQWTTDMTRIVKEWDLISPYRADPLGAELLRMKYSKLKTTDSDSDNDTWMISVNPTSLIFSGHISFVAEDNRIETFFVGKFTAGQVIRISGTDFNNGDYTVKRAGSFLVFETAWLEGAQLTNEITDLATVEIIQGGTYSLWRPPYTSVQGIPNPNTAFNTMLRPKLALIENSALIHSIMDLQEGTELKFQKADKNAELVTTLGVQTIAEKDPIQVGNMAPKLFRPYYLKFKTKVPISLLGIMNINPYGKVKFTSFGKDFYGYLWDGGIKPADNDEQEWVLISAPENDLSKVNEPQI